MNREERFTLWKETRDAARPPPDFADNVMRQIRHVDAARDARRRRVRDFLALLSLNPLAQSAVVAAAALLGLARLWVTAFVVF